MAFTETKVYFDGSHYIAIPHTTRPCKKRPKLKEETITVIENKSSLDNSEFSNLEENIEEDVTTKNKVEISKSEENKEKTQKNDKKSTKIHKTLTKKEFFNELYLKYSDLKKSERKTKIIEEMKPYFDTYEETKKFVETNFDRKLRNLICRRVRMTRKANLADFNYFVTFTYDDKLHTEESFKKRLKNCLALLSSRRGWRYMGIWERAPKTNRLHFHGLFHIPDGTMPGFIIKVRDYSTVFNKMQETYQSLYFNERFGRSDFKEIDENERKLGNALRYLMKYIEKTNEKIVYSKGLPQYFISDIRNDDVICTIGQEDKKLLLFDDFMCLDEGEIMGTVCPEVIAKMRKSN